MNEPNAAQEFWLNSHARVATKCHAVLLASFWLFTLSGMVFVEFVDPPAKSMAPLSERIAVGLGAEGLLIAGLYIIVLWQLDRKAWQVRVDGILIFGRDYIARFFRWEEVVSAIGSSRRITLRVGERPFREEILFIGDNDFQRFRAVASQKLGNKFRCFPFW